MTRSTVAMALPLTLALAGPLIAQLTPLGGETDASARAGVQALPVAAAASDGSMRLVWSEPFVGIHTAYLSPPESRGLAAKPGQTRAAGDSVLIMAHEHLPTPRGSGIVHERYSPVLTNPLGDGTFWMAWTEETKFVNIDILFYDEHTIDQDIHAARFGRDGLPIGAPIRVDLGGEAFQNHASVVARPDGGMLATWAHGDRSFVLAAGDGIRSRALDLDGRAVGSEQALDAGLVLGRNPAVAASADGLGALVAWEGTQDLTAPLGVWVRALDLTTGEPTGELHRIDEAPGYDQKRPSIAGLADGSFLVVWQSTVEETLTGRPHVQRTAIVGRHLAANGEPIGAVFTVSAGSAEQNTAPNVVALEDGRAVAAWLTWTPENWPLSILGAVIANDVASAEVDLSNWKVRDTIQPGLAAVGNTVLLSWSATQPQTQQAVVATRRFTVD